MKVIKIFFWIILSLAILAFLIIPPAIGLWIKHHYFKALTEINRKNQNITATISHYDFGWFCSKVSVRLDFHKMPLQNNRKNIFANNDIRVDGQLNIYHGPIIYIKQDRLNHINFALADIKANIPTLNVTGHSVWHFNNLLVSRFSSPAFKLVEDGETISMKNLQGLSKYNMATHRMRLQLRMNTLDVSNFIHLKQIAYIANLDQKGLVNYGKQKLSIGNLTLYTMQDSPIVLNNVSATSNTTLDSSNINLSFKYNIQSISENKFGVNGMQFNSTINGVNAKYFNQLLAAWQNQQNTEQNLINAMMKLLRHGVTVQVHSLKLKTNDGIVLLNGTFTIPTLSNSTHLSQLPAMIKASAYFQAPKIWIKQQITAWIGSSQNTAQQSPEAIASASLQRWENDNLLISSDNNYKARLAFQDGQLLINGKAPSMLRKDNQNSQSQSNSNNGLETNRGNTP